MTEKFKKIITIIIFLVITLILGLLIWFVFFKSAEKPNTPEINEGGGGTINNDSKLNLDNNNNIPNGSDFVVEENNLDGEDKQNTNNNGNLNQGGTVVVDKDGLVISPEKNITNPDIEKPIADGGKTITNIVIDYSNKAPISSGGGLITYNNNDGGFYKYDQKTGKNVLLTDDKFKGAENITWSPKTDKAVIEFPDGSNIVYDFNKKKQYILPTEWYEFSFQREGEKLAFMIDSSDFNKRWLSISNPDGSSFKAIEPLGNNADKVDVLYSPNEQMIAVSRTGEPLGTYRQQALLIGLNGENFDALEIEGRNFHPLWAPSGTKLIYDAYNKDTNYKPNIWSVSASSDKIGQSHRSLALNTWISKCVFDSTGINLYCAVPREMPDGAGMYPDMMNESEIYDDIYVVNINNAYKKKVAEPVPSVSIKSMVLSSDDSILYYTDAKSGKIYEMRLK